MHWTHKARLQNLLGALPEPAGNALYYGLQKISGSFREPRNNLFEQAALTIREKTLQAGRTVQGATFLEVGTGRRLTLPVCLWLMGAKTVHTVDLHRYLQDSIVALDLHALAQNQHFFDTAAVDSDRVKALRNLLAGSWHRSDLLRLCNINYLAPADAAALKLPAASIDIHFSYTVFEHIPAPVLVDILSEATRLLKPRGLGVHLVDHSDHFSHGDASISAVNFLQYDDATWRRLADNRYMYMNRCRADDYPALYERAGQKILEHEQMRDPDLRKELLSPSFALAGRFASKSEEVLTTTASWIVSQPEAR
jgi:SAM-dependent methyltransferase